MKSKLSIFLFLVFVYPSAIYSQDITEVVENMSIGQHNAVILSLPYDVKFVDTVWKDYLKTFKGKSRKVKKSDEVFTDDASVSYISNNTVDIYSVVLKNGEGSQLKMWMDLGGGFVDSQNFPDAYNGVQTMLQGFQKQLNVENIKIEFKNEETRLKDLEKDLSRLEKLNEKYQKEIEDWKAKISENEGLIDVNIKEQSEMQKSIEDQKKTLRMVEVKLARAETS